MPDTEHTLSASPADLRLDIRKGLLNGHTAGLAPGFLQGNLVILPAAYALDFFRFCQRNPKPCPLIGVTDSGNPLLHTLGKDLDIRTDLPAYNIYREGLLVDSRSEVSELWSSDSVGFALGCSFTFEHALQSAGFFLWHVEHDKTVPMYRSNLNTVAAGPFSGPTVVSMRTVPADRLPEVIKISKRFPLAHGAPLHFGDPAAIGIEDLSKPSWGDTPPPPDNNVPVFWACGVTPQVALEGARIPLCITHKPGHMLLTDVADDAESPVLQPSTITPPRITYE